MTIDKTKIIVAVTGTIGSGKSTVSAYLKQKGFCIYDCDKISLEVSKDASVIEQVRQTFGSRVLTADNQLNRKVLAAEVFVDQAKTQKLNCIFHTEVLRRLFAQIQSTTQNLIFVEIQVLKKEYANIFDKIWLMQSCPSIVYERVQNRDGRDKNQTTQIINLQQDDLNALQSQFADKTTVITNDTSLSELYSKIDKQLTALVDKK